MPQLPSAPPATVAFDPGAYSLRAAYTYERRCFLEGGWPVQLGSVMRALLTDAAAQAMPVMDTSHNVLRDTISRLATRYEKAPTVKEGELGELDPMILFADHPTVERYALAYNVAVVSQCVVDGELVGDVLPPDHADIRFGPNGEIRAVRLARPVLGKLNEYTLEEWDLVGLTYRVFGPKGWELREGYPWVYTDGKPFIPVTFFRASKPPDWWGADRWRELIEATLEEGVAWTIHRYGRLNSSSGLPYSIDCDVVGQTSEGSDAGQSYATAGPTFLMQLQSRANKSGAAGVLQPAFDPAKDVEAIVAAYNSRMQSLGLGDTALQRGGAESGYAIIMRREGLLRLRQSTEAMFRRADQEYVRKAVACTRLWGAGPKESTSYRISYAAVSMGSAENKELRDQEKHDLDVGIATPASVLADREGVALADAEAQLAARGLPPRPAPAVAATAAAAPGAVSPGAVSPVVQPSRVDREEYPFVGFVDFQGLKIDLENRKGDVRSGLNTDGSPWSVVMNYDYGEIRGTRGTDGDKLDVYVGPLHDSPLVVAVNQHDPVTGAFDEQKVMLGFATVEDAVAAYRSQYNSPGFYVEGDYEVLTFGAFWRAVKDRRFRGKRLDRTEIGG